jgi:coatomer subunit beta'
VASFLGNIFVILDGGDSMQMAYPSPQRDTKNKTLELRETVVVGEMDVNTANSVYKIQRQLFARSERVKGIDFHPVEPWILTTLYSGMSTSANNGILLLMLLPSRPCLHLVV